MKYYLIFLLILLTGCSTTKGKQILATTLAASAAGTLGAITAPKDESQMAHAMLWAGSAGTVTALTSLYIYDEEKKRIDAEQEIRMLKAQIEEDSNKYSPKLEQISSDPIYKNFPKSLAQMVKPGGWKLYKMDQWIEDSENRLIHQDRMIEIIPSQLLPRTNLSKGEKENENTSN